MILLRGLQRPKIRARSHCAIWCTAVAYQVQLNYFRQTGKFLAAAEMTTSRDVITEIWTDVNDMRRLGRLPNLRPGTGRDLFIVIDVPDHPQRVPHMVMPPFLDEDDVTPSRTMTEEPALLVRMPLNETPRTTTRDVINPQRAGRDSRGISGLP
jgi:hypothetical protein